MNNKLLLGTIAALVALPALVRAFPNNSPTPMTEPRSPRPRPLPTDNDYRGSQAERGIRNNNPGNIRISANNWEGKVPRTQNTDGVFEQFVTYEYGIRAFTKLLQNYMNRYNLRTITGIVSRYAPPIENDTSRYIQFVAQRTGYQANQVLTPTQNNLRAMVTAMGDFESGNGAISAAQFDRVWNRYFFSGNDDIIAGRVGAILKPNTLSDYTTLCKDGTYSNSNSRWACMWHGGVESYNTPLNAAARQGASVEQLEAHPSAVYLVPLSKVGFDRQLFQNRESEYSEESVQRIMEAVANNTFRFEVFDPILLWRRKGNRKLIVLSGHSRTEAFKRLSRAGKKDFKRIPAKIIEVTEQEARRIARNSNNLATRETDTERATYYRSLRDEGVNPKEVQKLARKSEGTNAKRILSFSYLNPNGRTFTTLKALEGRDDTSQENIKNVANWIGAARQRFPELSNLHEDELYKFLTDGAFGRQFTRQGDFLKKVQQVILQRTEFGRFHPDTPLNIQNVAAPTASERNYNAQRAALSQTVKELDKAVKDKLAELNKRAASQADINRIISPMEQQLRVARQRLLDFEQNATRPSAANELNLFAVSGKYWVI